MQWGTILRNSNLAGADQAAYAFHNWIKDMIARNRPYDEFVRGIVAAAGEWQDAPAINWYWQRRDDQLHQVTADTAQVFLGIRLQCARCHHHPYERWGQDDYYGLAGFFTRLGRKSFGEPPPYYASANVTTGEKNPLTGKTPEPKYLDGPVGEVHARRRTRGTRWSTGWRSRTIRSSPRPWSIACGATSSAAACITKWTTCARRTRRPTPNCSTPWPRTSSSHKFDVKHVIRTIVNSRVYQLSSEPTDAQQERPAELRPLLRPAAAGRGVPRRGRPGDAARSGSFSGVSSNARAVDLPHEGFGSYFLDTFDRPRRVTGCECERSTGATLAQVLLLANSDEIENKIAAGNGRRGEADEGEEADPRDHRGTVPDGVLAAGRPPRN